MILRSVQTLSRILAFPPSSFEGMHFSELLFLYLFIYLSFFSFKPRL